MSAAENADLHSHHAELIAKALATEGGHLSIGRGGFILWYGDGCRLLGYDPEPIKAACIEAGLPVIDSRGVAFDAVAQVGGHIAFSVPERHGIAEHAANLRQHAAGILAVSLGLDARQAGYPPRRVPEPECPRAQAATAPANTARASRSRVPRIACPPRR